MPHARRSVVRRAAASARLSCALLTLSAASPASAVQPMGCLIEPERVADVGSPVIGVLQSVAVERGERVRAGQVIAYLSADVERAAVVVAESRAESEAEVHAAEVSAEFARQQRVRAEELFARKVISRQAFDQTRSESDIADHRLAETRARLQQARGELGLARAQLAERTITSPLDGIVTERFLSTGERVEDQAVVRVAKIDPLRVQIVVPVALYGTLAMGDAITVTPELPQAEPAVARVVNVDRVIDAASNTFRVQLELPNPEFALPAGLRCQAELGVDPGTAGAGATAAR